MKKHQYRKIGLIACVAALFTAMQVHAVDMAEATGLIADIAVALTQANTVKAAAAPAAAADPLGVPSQFMALPAAIRPRPIVGIPTAAAPLPAEPNKAGATAEPRIIAVGLAAAAAPSSSVRSKASSSRIDRSQGCFLKAAPAPA